MAVSCGGRSDFMPSFTGTNQKRCDLYYAYQVYFFSFLGQNEAAGNCRTEKEVHIQVSGLLDIYTRLVLIIQKVCLRHECAACE
jgi:hypothetical protein